MNLTIYRGDSYAIARPLYRHEFTDKVGAAYPLTGCTVRSTFKVAKTDPGTDPTDSTAVIKATLEVNGIGVATTETKMFLVGAATDGICELRLTATDTAALDAEEEWISDVELTDINGEVVTFEYTDTLSAIDGVTNRVSG